MFILRKVIYLFLRSILFLFLFIALYLLCVWLFPKIKVNTDYSPSKTGTEVYVSSNGMHTDFIVPVQHSLKNWLIDFPPNSFESVDSTFQYVSIGWGDKGFFLNTPTWADLKFSTAFKAAFGLSSTAMHVTYIKHKPTETEMCKKIILNAGEYQKLINYITSSFQVKNQSLQLIKHPGYDEYDNFYEANGTYSFINTCNVWTGDGLRSIGVEIGLWTPLEGGIMNSL